MLRSALRGDRKCTFLFVISIVLFLFSLSFVSAQSCLSESKCNFCPGVYRETPKSYTLKIEGVMNCEDGSFSELNGETKLVQYTQDWGACLYSNSGRENGYPIGTELHISNYNGFGINVISGDTMYFQFNPTSCTETMETGFLSDISCDSLYNENPLYVYGGTATLTPCKVPEIENLTIYPEYDSEKYTNKTNLTYEEIFPDNKLKPYANLTIKYSDESIPGDEEKFNVSYTIEFHYPLELEAKHPELYKKLPENSTNCSKNCRIEIPEEDVDQDTLIKVTAYISNWRETKTAYRQTPVFDMIAESIDAGNVIFGMNDLVENKPIVTRANVKINSYLRKMGLQGGFYMNYIDSIEDISVDFIVDGAKEMNSKEKLVNYGDAEELKQKVTNILLSIDERRKAMETLNEIHKKAKDTINFIGYIPKGKTSSIALKVALDDVNEINEFNKTNNDFSKTYALRSQKDSNFTFMFTGINFKILEVNIPLWFIGGSAAAKAHVFNLEDYEQEKLRMNEAYDFFNSAFPFDSTKVSKIVKQKPAVLLIATPSLWSLETGSGVDIDEDSLDGLQKQADKYNGDMIFGVIPSEAANLINRQISGITIPSDYSKAAVIRESMYYGAYAHEAGHLFGLYLNEEQKSGLPCPASAYSKQDVGLLSSDGWCMDQKTGKGCTGLGAWDTRGINGEIINIWKDRDEIGCYYSVDGPPQYASLPFEPKYLFPRKFDIMSLSNSVWPLQDPTYNKLMEKILA